MQCPHCRVEVHPAFYENFVNSGRPVGNDEDPSVWSVMSMKCPSCEKTILELSRTFIADHSVQRTLIYPQSFNRPTASNLVPADLREDFNEAIAVMDYSPKASAALSRRCLQSILKYQGFAQDDLAKAIGALLASKTLPSTLASNVDAIRNIGNFAAHPLKDSRTGEILPVEPHEAEWNLDVLEGLFDFFYVQPAKDKARIEALNVKLAAAGKKPIKT